MVLCRQMCTYPAAHRSQIWGLRGGAGSLTAGATGLQGWRGLLCRSGGQGEAPWRQVLSGSCLGALVAQVLLAPAAVAAAAAETAAVAADTAAAAAAVVAEFVAVALVSDVGVPEGSRPDLGPRPRPGRFAPPLCGGPLVQAGRWRRWWRSPRGRR
jgi:hypothetical protein